MFVYNVTTKIDHAVFTEWLIWQQQVYIPAMMATDLFIDFKLYELLDTDETEGITYVTQYFIDDLTKYEKYLNTCSKNFSEMAVLKWNNKFITFKTLMQSVQ